MPLKKYIGRIFYDIFKIFLSPIVLGKYTRSRSRIKLGIESPKYDAQSAAWVGGDTG